MSRFDLVSTNDVARSYASTVKLYVERWLASFLQSRSDKSLNQNVSKFEHPSFNFWLKIRPIGNFLLIISVNSPPNESSNIPTTVTTRNEFQNLKMSREWWFEWNVGVDGLLSVILIMARCCQTTRSEKRNCWFSEQRALSHMKFFFALYLTSNDSSFIFSIHSFSTAKIFYENGQTYILSPHVSENS